MMVAIMVMNVKRNSKPSSNLTSSPLFIIVALSTVILAPIAQFGCFRAIQYELNSVMIIYYIIIRHGYNNNIIISLVSYNMIITNVPSATLTFARSALSQSRNAPPDAVRMIRLRAPGGKPCRD